MRKLPYSTRGFMDMAEFSTTSLLLPPCIGWVQRHYQRDYPHVMTAQQGMRLNCGLAKSPYTLSTRRKRLDTSLCPIPILYVRLGFSFRRPRPEHRSPSRGHCCHHWITSESLSVQSNVWRKRASCRRLNNQQTAPCSP